MNWVQRGLVRALGLQVGRESNVATGTVASGVDMFSGRFDYEETRALTGPQKWDTLDRMEADPKITQALNGVILPMVTSDWEFQSPDKEDPIALEFSELCNANILDKTTERFGEEYFQQTPWKAQRLPERLRMLRDGFAAIATTLHNVDAGGGLRRVYSKTQWLEPATLDDSSRPWEIDSEGNIVGIRRTYFDPQQKVEMNQFLPAERLKLYVYGMLGERYEGRMFVRPMYGPWFRKDFKQKRELLWAQKIGAPMPYGVPPRGYSPENLNRMAEAIRTMRGTAADRGYAMLPRGDDGEPPELKFAESSRDSSLDKMSAIIEAENREIAAAGMTKSMGLGEGSSSGNRALGEVQGRMEALQQQSIEEVLATWMTFGVGNLEGEVRELRRLNYPPNTPLPMLVSTKLDPFVSIRNSGEVIQGWDKKIIPHTPEVRKQFTERHGFKIEDDEAFEIEEEPVAPPNPLGPGDPDQPGLAPGDPPDQPGSPGPPDDDPDPDEGSPEGKKKAALQARLAATDRFRDSIADLLVEDGGARRMPGSFRKPLKFETMFVNLAEVNQTMVAGDAAANASLTKASNLMRVDLIARLDAGKVTLRNLKGLRASRPVDEKAMAKDLSRVLTKIGKAGAQQVEDELKRQEVISQGIGLAVNDEEIAGFEDDIESRVTISIDEIWKRELGNFLEGWDDGTRAELLPDDMRDQLEAAMAALSPKPIEKVARHASTVAYNEGRSAEILSFDERTDGPQFVVRSEVLDTGTCPPCTLLDSEIFEIGSAEFFANEPPLQCDGGKFCRGFYVAIGGR